MVACSVQQLQARLQASPITRLACPGRRNTLFSNARMRSRSGDMVFLTVELSPASQDLLIIRNVGRRHIEGFNACVAMLGSHYS